MHYVGLLLFRNLPHVLKSANLTIHVILWTIEDYIRRNDNKHPDEIYMQVDGGSENANISVHAFCESLVANEKIGNLRYHN